jgi:hypothetical protein
VEEGLSQQNILYIPLTILQHTTSMTSVFTSPDAKTDPSRSIILMDRQSVMMYLGLKVLNTVEIRNDLVATLKGEAKSYSNVTYYLRKPNFASLKTPQPSESPAPILDESNEAILLALSEKPFASVRQLACRTRLHSSKVYDHITHKLGCTVRYLHWVPLFCRKLTSIPEHKFHLNSSRWSSTRKTDRGRALSH